MWLRAIRESQLIHHEPDDYASSWCVDVMAATDLSAPASGPEAYPVGRILADELRRFEIAEWGEDVWTVADADSSGLEAAWAAVLDEEGTFREDEFDGPADPVIYLYRFKLHEDFSAWRLAVLDACCRVFGQGALVLAQHHTTWLSEAEFELLGFRFVFSARVSEHRPGDTLYGTGQRAQNRVPVVRLSRGCATRHERAR